MKKEVSILIPAQKEKDEKFIFEKICGELKKSGIKFSPDEISVSFEKKSIDARRKEIKLFLKYTVFIGEKIQPKKILPEWKNVCTKKSVVIVGSGPAGLFGALKLLEYGIKPIIVERGKEIFGRKRDIAKIGTDGTVDENSNYCFGEGGAGTFSDGKLYTRSNKRGDIGSVLQIFVHFGADKKILTDSHPHIGTDKLPAIVSAMKNFIEEKGGEFLFETRLKNFVTENFGGKKIVRGILCEDLNSPAEKKILCDAVLLATGHSAADVYFMLAKISPESLEAKTFAAGVRVEHPREKIDCIQFHGKNREDGFENLGAAEYRLSAQIDGRGVYSFCMCPGGFVVPSATGKNEIVVNGMSAAKRNGKWSNSAIVVETRPEDVPQIFFDEAKNFGTEKLAPLLFRMHLENETFKNGSGQKAPAQRLDDFLSGKKSESLPQTSYAPGIVSRKLDDFLPEQISARLKKAFKIFDGSMKGFVCHDALLIAAETRTSTPVRILRDKNSFESVALENLFPAGEGSGYSGGIVSSAMDGENACEKIAEKFGCKK
jgi:hypothetical protein